MSAIRTALRGEHPARKARSAGLWCALALALAACAREEPEPAAGPRGVAAVPIVDMSPSAQRPLLPEETPVVAAGATSPPDLRPVPRAGATVVPEGDIAALRSKALVIPVAGVRAADLVSSFADSRGAGSHEALDIAAARGTPVLAADHGTVLKLFTSRAGGLTIYVAEASGRFVYYYAHLDAYAPGLAEGQAISKGQQIGTVGTSGNAPPNTPHLHFAILRNDDPDKWWGGTPIDPFPILRATPATRATP